jgi:hypothetical protein
MRVVARPFFAVAAAVLAAGSLWAEEPRPNPFFAKTLVNRYWKHFFGRGIVDPEDDMRDTNPASNKELLDGLTKKFIDSDPAPPPLENTLVAMERSGELRRASPRSSSISSSRTPTMRCRRCARRKPRSSLPTRIRSS